MATVYFQNHVVTITFEEELQLGTAVWSGFLNSQEFREAITNCIELIEGRKLLRWLGDNRQMKAIRPVDQEWFVEHIMPRLQQSALRRNAVLVSEDFFNRTAVEQIYRRAEGQGEMTTKEFSSKITALAWLKEPINTPA
ncbi:MULTISPECIES: STAS/SEC14 domain-containing protein [Rufibacter]|uniref:STAS/SEC14 domain-containing protein n=1 Tax=Rufibacter TaxID=1379908 RepID=UPI001B30116C|nr:MULTISPECIES: STAS/SEC14 domain-containing protein [Rufibacter]